MMKLAYPFLTEETKSPLLGVCGEPEEVFHQLKTFGYEGIELLVRDPDQIDVKRLKDAVTKNQLVIASIGTAPIVSDEQLTFTSSKPEERRATIDRLKEVIAFAEQFQCPVNIGKLRGNLVAGHEKASYDWMCDGFKEAGEYAWEYGIDIAIEPQNESNLNYLNTTTETLSFIKAMNMPSLKIMLDTFHMDISEKSIHASIIEAKEHLIFMHFADENREAPGKGNIPFNEIINALNLIDYKGFISMEISQSPTSYEAAKDAIDYVNSIK